MVDAGVSRVAKQGSRSLSGSPHLAAHFCKVILAHPLASNAFQSPIEVLDQVTNIFDADREAYQTIG